MTYEITDAFAREWNRIRTKVDNMSGEGVYNEPGSITIYTPQSGGRSQPSAPQTFPVPEYVGMCLMAVAQNVLGADFPIAHDLPT